jgi:short-subunit dehydrogenase
VEERAAHDPTLELLVNNAGFITFTPVAQHDADLLETMITVHVTALVRLTRAALPGMIARGHGAIINVASVTAFFTAPDTIATYAATKAFVTTFTRGVHEEVRTSGVRVQALCPGLTRTELYESTGAPSGVSQEAAMSAEALVDASLVGLQLGEVLCVPSLDDVGLLSKLTEVQDAITARAMSTGVPAERYTAPETDLK